MPMRTDISPLAQLMQRVDAAADGAPPADTVPTGFPTLDRMLGGGMRRGDLVVLGGDVGAGKSAFALAIALRAAAGGRTVEFLSGEMDTPRILERALAIEGRAPVDDLRRGTLSEEARAALGAAAVRMRDRLPRTGRISPQEVDEITSLLTMGGAQLAVVDSLQSLPSGHGPLDDELAAAVRELKRAAVSTGVAVLLTAQLPALARQRADPRPTLDDFGALGAVKHHADVVLGLFREELYRPGEGTDGATELVVLKNRNGPVGYLDLYFYKQWLRFEDLAEPEPS